jgi:hypothetical protein
MRLRIAILCLIRAACWAADVPATRIRDAAGRAITLVQSTQKTWYVKQSCHS